MSRRRAAVEADCTDWAAEIAGDYVPDLVVFLAKSGFLFARPLAECFSCEMVDLEVSRSSNSKKDAIAKAIPWLPTRLLALALRSRAMYDYHDEDPERSLKVTERFERVDFSRHSRILVVDDSVDTGWSMLAAVDAVKRAAPTCEVKTAGYCVIDASKKRVNVDFARHRNMIVLTATSRYSPEYGRFLEDLEQWRMGVCS